MTIFICLDAQNGMLFNHRRQSRDEAVLEDMLATAEGKIWMNEYSSKLFSAVPEKVIIDEEFLECAPKGSFCFLENISLKPYEERAAVLVVYCWNRVYPADTCLDMDLDRNWEMTDIKEFEGTSHEKITRKTYIRKDQ